MREEERNLLCTMDGNEMRDESFKMPLKVAILDSFAVLRESMAHEFECDPQNIFFRCVEDSNEAIMISDKTGVLVYVNPAWSRIYGFSNEEALGKTPRLLHSGLQSNSYYENMWSRIRDPNVGHWKGEVINKAKDGTLVPVLLTITPFRSQKTNEISGYMGIAVDITDKKELEAKVAHQDRLASIGLLASGLAHEIGTPLGVVRGRAEFMMMQAESPVVRKNLGVIISEIDRISKLIRSLLRMSRSFSDVLIEEISPAAVANGILALVGENFHEDSVEIQVNIPSEMKVKADFGRLEQIFLNLIMNSVHAIRKAKKLGRTKGHFLRVEAEAQSNGEAVIHIKDSGCGIPPENMGKLFKPFFTTKDIGEGTGLGLAIVAQLVREMEGQITVESVVDQGTTFSLILTSA